MKNETSILVPIPALFSFEECLWFLNRNYDDCLHVIDENSITKAIEFEGRILLFRIVQTGSFLEVNILKGEISQSSKEFVMAYVVKWFDLSRNIQPFYDLLEKDSRLAYMAADYKGLRLIGIADLFETICWCIIGQQINLSFAYKVKRALVEKYGTKVDFEGESYYIFPKSAVLAALTIEDLKEIQFSKQKALYVIGTAEIFASGTLTKEHLMALPDFDSRKKALTNLKGIGAWTANYVLMKCLGDPECITHGDIGLLNALASHNIISQRNETDKIESFFKIFAGWESYLVFYLWRSLTVRI